MKDYNNYNNNNDDDDDNDNGKGDEVVSFLTTTPPPPLTTQTPTPLEANMPCSSSSFKKTKKQKQKKDHKSAAKSLTTTTTTTPLFLSKSISKSSSRNRLRGRPLCISGGSTTTTTPLTEATTPTESVSSTSCQFITPVTEFSLWLSRQQQQQQEHFCSSYSFLTLEKQQDLPVSDDELHTTQYPIHNRHSPLVLSCRTLFSSDSSTLAQNKQQPKFDTEMMRIAPSSSSSSPSRGKSVVCRRHQRSSSDPLDQSQIRAIFPDNKNQYCEQEHHHNHRHAVSSALPGSQVDARHEQNLRPVHPFVSSSASPSSSCASVSSSEATNFAAATTTTPFLYFGYSSPCRRGRYNNKKDHFHNHHPGATSPYRETPAHMAAAPSRVLSYARTARRGNNNNKKMRTSTARLVLWIWTAVGLLSTTCIVLYQSSFLDRFLKLQQQRPATAVSFTKIQFLQQRQHAVAWPLGYQVVRHFGYQNYHHDESFSSQQEQQQQYDGYEQERHGQASYRRALRHPLSIRSSMVQNSDKQEEGAGTGAKSVVSKAEEGRQLKSVAMPPPSIVMAHHVRYSAAVARTSLMIHYNHQHQHHPTSLTYHDAATTASQAIVVSLDGRPLQPYNQVPHRPLDLYPATYTDQTQLYGVLDSEDDRLQGMEPRVSLDNCECVPMHKWQTDFHPSCNEVHAMGLERLGQENNETDNNSGAAAEFRFQLFGTKGYWRNAWRVDDIVHNDTLVLKTLKLQHNFEEAHFEHDRVDAVAMERLTASPHVINIFGFCGHSVVTEYANGKRLGDLADKSQKIPLARLRIARDIAQGLSDLHHMGQNDYGDGPDFVASFVHLDINPANVVSVNGTLKLNDFNIGILRQWNTTSNKPCGFPAQYPNPQWRSPEEARNESNLTEKVDVFSMGHIFFRLICGHEPWNKLEPNGKPSKAEVTDKVRQGLLPTIPEHVFQSTSAEVVAIRQAMLDCYTLDPVQRPSSYQIARQLQAALDQLERDHNKSQQNLDISA